MPNPSINSTHSSMPNQVETSRMAAEEQETMQQQSQLKTALLPSSVLVAPPVRTVSQNTQKVILTLAILYNGLITSGGMIYGFPGLQQLMKDEGQYSAACPNYDPNQDCPNQDNYLNNIFAVAANIATVATIFYGFTLDRFGVRSNAISGVLLMMMGFIFLAYSTSFGEGYHFDGFMAGLSLIAFGGLGTFLVAFQFANVFKRHMVVLSTENALFAASALIFTFGQYLYESFGITRRTSFLAYVGFLGLALINMILVYPANSYKTGDRVHLPILGWLGLDPAPKSPLENDKLLPEPESNQEDYQTLQHPTADAAPANVSVAVVDEDAPWTHTDQIDTSATGKIATPEQMAFLYAELKHRALTAEEKAFLIRSRTLKQEILNLGTILLSLFFGVLLLSFNFYNANISTLLTAMGAINNYYANIFVFVISLVPAACGFPIESIQIRYGYSGLSAASVACLILAYILLYISNPGLQILGFFGYAIGNVCLFSVIFSFIATQYRHEHYGRIVAFVTTIVAIIGLFQLELQNIFNSPSNNNNFVPFNIGLMVAMVGCFSFPYWCYKHRV